MAEPTDSRNRKPQHRVTTIVCQWAEFAALQAFVQGQEIARTAGLPWFTEVLAIADHDGTTAMTVGAGISSWAGADVSPKTALLAPGKASTRASLCRKAGKWTPRPSVHDAGSEGLLRAVWRARGEVRTIGGSPPKGSIRGCNRDSGAPCADGEITSEKGRMPAPQADQTGASGQEVPAGIRGILGTDQATRDGIRIALGTHFWTGNRRADWKIASRSISIGRLLLLGTHPSGAYMETPG